MIEKLDEIDSRNSTYRSEFGILRQILEAGRDHSEEHVMVNTMNSLSDCLAALEERIQILENEDYFNEKIVPRPSKCEYDWKDKAYKAYEHMLEIQITDPSSKYDPYMRGMANGMIFLDSCIRGVEPKYIDKPPVPPRECETYPCDKCGVKRTRAEGGNIFMLCDKCWDEHFKPTPSDEPKLQPCVKCGKPINRNMGQAWRCDKCWKDEPTISISRQVAEEWLDCPKFATGVDATMKIEIRRAIGK
jgi:hypothetical protein